VTGKIPAVAPGSIELLSANFGSVQIESGSPEDAVFSNVTGVLNPALAAFLGITVPFDGSITAAISLTSGTPGEALTGTNVSGTIAAVPEPHSISAILILVGTATLFRRRWLLVR